MIWRLTGSLSFTVAFPARTRARVRTFSDRMRSTLARFSKMPPPCAAGRTARRMLFPGRALISLKISRGERLFRQRLVGRLDLIVEGAAAPVTLLSSPARSRAGRRALLISAPTPLAVPRGRAGAMAWHATFGGSAANVYVT